MIKIKKFQKLWLPESEKSESSAPLELTTLKGMPVNEANKLVMDNYPGNITYRGNEF